MLNYRMPSGLPSGSRAAWSRLLLQPLAGDLMTPLSYSVLGEVAGRAWFTYYDKLGFDPMPRAHVARQHNGRAYFNLTLSAQREGEFAALEPISFVVDGAAQPLVKVEKPGFLAGMKSGRAARRLEAAWDEFAAAGAAQAERAAAWNARVADFKWTQAEILQIMEEIEPDMVAPFASFLAARQGLLLSVNRLMRLANQPPAETLRQIDRGLGSAGVIEADMARALGQMAQKATPALRNWVAAGDFAGWEDQLRSGGLLADMESFQERYGHRAAAPAELAAPRWREDPAPLLRLLAEPPAAPAAADDHAISVLLASIDSADTRARKEAQASIDLLRKVVPMQSRAIDTLSHYFAGARRWAWGASKEAMSDQRLAAADDVFCFELEELKRMMTNEWNVSDSAEIQATAAKRRAQYDGWKNASAPELLLGDAPAETLDRLEPSPVLLPGLHLQGVRPRNGEGVSDPPHVKRRPQRLAPTFAQLGPSPRCQV